MSAREKSDLPKVAEKRVNKVASAAAELVERRGGAKENAELQSTVRTQSRAAVSQAQSRIREAVIRNRRDKLTALLHHLTVDVLRASFFGLKKFAAPGVDEMTWTEYSKGLEGNLVDLHSRVQTGAYRALPSRRTYIPKPDGRQRPLGIAALEDKIVQAAVVAILTPIYEAGSWASATGSDRSANSTKRWMRSRSGSAGGASTGCSIAMSELVKPGEIKVIKLNSQYPEPKNIDGAPWVRGNVVLQDLDALDIGKPERCSVFHVYDTNNPFFQLLNRLDPRPLTTFPVEALLHEYHTSSEVSTDAKMEIRMAIIAISGCVPQFSGAPAK
jgi:hypothetical protein